MRSTTRQPLVPAIAGLALPAILSFLLQNLYHVNDAFFLGLTGPDAVNAMGLFMMVSIANFGFVLTLARGTQSLVGRRFGGGNLDGCQLALTQGMGLALLVFLPLGVLEWIFIPEIMGAMGGQGATLDNGVAYVRQLMLFLPFLFASPLLEFSFQALGDVRTPFKLQLMAVLVNTGLNWLLVLPHELSLVSGAGGSVLRFDGLELPLPFAAASDNWAVGGLGVVGAATATGLSRFVAAVAGFTIMVRRKGLHLLLRRVSYRFDPRVAKEILRVGLPSGSSTFLYATVGFFISRIIGGFGQDAYGAYGIGFRGVESISFMVVLGFGVATGTVAAHAVGAGDIARARRCGHVGVALASCVMLVTTGIFLAIPERLASFYTDDATILAMAATYITVMSACQVPQAFEMVYGDAMAGSGSSLRAALISIPGNILRIPLAWLLAQTFGLGLAGVWYAIAASAALKGLGMLLLFLSGAWEKAMHAGREMLGTP